MSALNVDPAVLIRQWLVTVIQAAGASTRITTQLDPGRGLPQIVITGIRATPRALGDGRLHLSLSEVHVAVTAVAAGGARPDFAGAFAALSPVMEAISPFVPWTSSGGPTIDNVSGVVGPTRALEPVEKGFLATQTLTFVALVCHGPVST